MNTKTIGQATHHATIHHILCFRTQIVNLAHNATSNMGFHLHSLLHLTRRDGVCLIARSLFSVSVARQAYQTTRNTILFVS